MNALDTHSSVKLLRKHLERQYCKNNEFLAGSRDYGNIAKKLVTLKCVYLGQGGPKRNWMNPLFQCCVHSSSATLLPR